MPLSYAHARSACLSICSCNSLQSTALLKASPSKVYKLTLSLQFTAGVLQREGQEEARHLGLFFFKEDDAAAMVATVRSVSRIARQITFKI